MLIELKTKDERTFKLDLQCAVIKIGSAVITRELGKLDEELIDAYANAISRLLKLGIRIVIVSSGAVSAGIGEIGSQQLPQSIPEKQALAAIGQSKLMRTYAEAFNKYGRKVAQILLTRGDMEDRRRYLNARY
ncbi:MAG: glutamate 5-kinase, partial [Candidatus Sumerlaeia bacterium]|nr:glutamate 5-kinase [Candidatus Sumerlaeia bacterium]